MKIIINKNKVRDVGIICFLCIYFASKLLWDSVPYLFEILSVGIIVYGALKTILQEGNKKIYLVFLFFVFTIYILINAFLKDSTRQFMRAMYEYIFYMMIFWGTYYWGKRARIEDYSGILLKVGFVICVLSWIEYLSHHYILPNAIKYDGSFVGFRTIVFSRTFLAHGMVLAFFALLGFYMYIIYKEKKYILYGIFAFLTILTTGSRGPLVACFVGIFVMFALFEFLRNGFSIRKLILILCCFILLCTLWYAINSDFQLSNSILNYFLNRIRSIFDWNKDDGNTGRIVIWTHYYKIFKENFWFGVGPSQTGSWDILGKYGATESGILKRLCDLGVVGTTLHYLFVLSILLKGLLSLQKNKEDNNLFFYIALFLAVFIDDITLQATEEVIVAFYMWYALAGIENSNNRMKVRGQVR